MQSFILPTDFRVLVLEDEYFLARELKDTMIDFGANMVEMTGSVHDAFRLLEAQDFNLGILDVSLHGEMSYTFADKLTARNIPFIFVTGFEKRLMPSRFFNADVLSKPYVEADMINGLKNAIARTAQN